MPGPIVASGVAYKINGKSRYSSLSYISNTPGSYQTQPQEHNKILLNGHTAFSTPIEDSLAVQFDFNKGTVVLRDYGACVATTHAPAAKKEGKEDIEIDIEVIE